MNAIKMKKRSDRRRGKVVEKRTRREIQSIKRQIYQRTSNGRLNAIIYDYELKGDLQAIIAYFRERGFKVSQGSLGDLHIEWGEGA